MAIPYGGCYDVVIWVRGVLLYELGECCYIVEGR